MRPALLPSPVWNALPVLLLLLPAGALAQSAGETVGRIEGHDIAVKGQVNLVREGNRSATVLASGSEVTVRSGQARITLADGGEIDICGPAQFTVLKSGGSLTLALGEGRVRARLADTPAITVYTALIVAAPLAVGDGPRDATVGVEADGSVCVLAARGAVRLEEQLTGRSLTLPENGEMILPGGQLEALRDARGECQCEGNLARGEPAAPVSPRSGAVAVGPGDSEKTDAAKREAPKPAREEPKWTVVMPPLTFDAARPPPALDPRPETILLVREVRVQPAIVFSGRVERPRKKKNRREHTGATARGERLDIAAAPADAAPQAVAPEKKQGGGFGTKFRNFFRRLFGRKPKN